jgi:alcohol dehydrogenase
MTMKSLMMTKYGDVNTSLELQEVPLPVINPNQIRIKTFSASFNPFDYKVLRGDFKAIRKIKFPRGIGRDVSGVIDEVGEKVKSFKVGDKVYARINEEFVGTMAESVISNVDDVALIPSSLNHVEAASIPLAGLTSYQALIDIVKLSKGEDILIHAGSGGVGTIAIQLAKHIGANVTTTTSTKNIDFVKDLGADTIIDYTKKSYLQQGTKFDVVFDTLGGGYTLDSFKVLKTGGRVVSIAGELDSVTTKQIGLNKLIRFVLALKARKITNAAKKIGASYRFLLMSPNGEQLKELAKLYDSASIKPVIDKVFNLDESIQALDYLAKGRARGKIVVKIKE